MKNEQPKTTELTSESSLELKQLPNRSQSKKIGLIIGGIFLLVITGVSGYYLGLNHANNATITSKSNSISYQNSADSPRLETAIPSSSPGIAQKANFSKRLYDSTKPWFQNIEYPSVLTAIKEEDLVNLSCSLHYTSDYQGGYLAFPEGGPENLQADAALLAQAEIAARSSGKRVDDFTSCQTETGLTLFEFTEAKGNGGAGNTVFLGVINNKAFELVATLPNPGVSYFGCYRSLQLTTDRHWYVECGGGDGASGGNGIFDVDLVNKTVTKVNFCTSQLGTVSCEQ